MPFKGSLVGSAIIVRRLSGDRWYDSDRQLQLYLKSLPSCAWHRHNATDVFSSASPFWGDCHGEYGSGSLRPTLA